MIALGLGLAIDYSLFIVSRYREELVREGPRPAAMRRTLATAGRTVTFSALTVAAALASLLIFPQRFLYSMGLGGVVVTLVALATSLIALPALLVLLGPRVNALSPARWKRAIERTAGQEQSGAWYRIAHAVTRRPATVAILSAAVLIAAGLPALGIRFTGTSASDLPPSSAPRQVDQQSSLASRLPLGILILAVLTVTILFLLTGSVVLPLKSLLMNVLTLSAAFGLLVQRPREPTGRSHRPREDGADRQHRGLALLRGDWRLRHLEDHLHQRGRHRHRPRRDHRRDDHPRPARPCADGAARDRNWWAPAPLKRLHQRIGVRETRAARPEDDVSGSDHRKNQVQPGARRV